MSSCPTTQYKYSIFCETEGFPVFGYSINPPTCCYNNAAHTVNSASVKQLGQIQIQQTVLQLESEPTGGHYGSKAYSFIAAPNTTTSYQTSFPFPVTLLTAQIQASIDMVGDCLDFPYAPHTPIGYLTMDAKSSETQLTVSNTVIQNSYIGLYAYLTDGVNFDSCGRIISIDTATSKVIIESPLIHSFSSTSPTYFLITRYFVKDYEIRIAGFHRIGYGKIGGGKTPAGVSGECVYTNFSSTPKVVAFMIEYFF